MGFWALDVQELQVAGFFLLLQLKNELLTSGKSFLQLTIKVSWPSEILETFFICPSLPISSFSTGVDDPGWAVS